MKIVIASITALMLTGCAAQGDYKLYAETQAKVAEAKAFADAKKYEALASIAKDGDSAAKVAAVMSLNGQTSSVTGGSIEKPVSWTDKIMDFTARIFPGVASIYSVKKNADVATVSSNNARDVSINRNETMVDLVHGETFVITDEDNNQSVDRQ